MQSNVLTENKKGYVKLQIQKTKKNIYILNKKMMPFFVTYDIFFYFFFWHCDIVFMSVKMFDFSDFLLMFLDIYVYCIYYSQ